ncbi:MAG: hypothetical protein ACXVM0_15520 [Flavisolibacter sp.]
MKTFRLSSLAFACLCLFNACTKDNSQTTTTTDQNSLGTQAARTTVLGNGVGNTAVEPTMTISYNPNPGIVNQPVTVTGTFSTGQTAPTCGKLDLQEYENNQWVSVSAPVDITTTNQQLTYTFTPTVVGTDVYQFRLHFIKGGCPGFANAFSASFPLTVIEACEGLTMKGAVIAATPSAQPGYYDFTVRYTVTTCGLSFDKLKVQGGLTDATAIIAAGTSGPGTYSTWIPGGSTNHIQRWVEETPGVKLSTAKRVYTTQFTKLYSGSGQVELTGDWSVSLTWMGADAGTASFPKIYYQ